MDDLMASAVTATHGANTPISFSDMNTLTVLDVGGNDGKHAKEFYPNSQVTVVDKKNGWDVMKRGLPQGKWDVVLANHIIEHLDNPDCFLRECHKVMRNGTILDIGTPNLVAWFNRILFLFGYVPHSVELSKQFNIGKAFGWNNEGLGGHIYVYTPQALADLLSKHGFKVYSITGEASTYPCHFIIKWIDKLMTWISPSLASAFRIKCTTQMF